MRNYDKATDRVARTYADGRPMLVYVEGDMMHRLILDGAGSTILWSRPDGVSDCDAELMMQVLSELENCAPEYEAYGAKQLPGARGPRIDP